MDVNELSIKVWKKSSGATWALLGTIPRWSGLSAEFRHLQPGPISMTIPYDSVTQKINKTHMLTVDFRGERWTYLIEHDGPKSTERGGVEREIGGSDALSLLGDVLCWPVPTAPLSTQSEAHYTVTAAPAETHLLNMIGLNMITRRGDGIVMAPTHGYGGTVYLNERFSNLLAAVTNRCANHNLGVRVGLVQSSESATRATLTCWFYQPRDLSLRVRLSSKVGTLGSWSQADDAPTGTRAIVGGGGEGTARIFRQTIQTAAESEWGRKRELFIDARDTVDTADMDSRAADALTDAAAQSSFDLQATDAAGMRYADHYTVGDKVTIELLTGVAKVDTLSVVVVNSDTANATVQLKPGNPDAADPLFAQAAIVRGIRQQVQALQQEA